MGGVVLSLFLDDFNVNPCEEKHRRQEWHGSDCRHHHDDGISVVPLIVEWVNANIVEVAMFHGICEPYDETDPMQEGICTQKQ